MRSSQRLPSVGDLVIYVPDAAHPGTINDPQKKLAAKLGSCLYFGRYDAGYGEYVLVLASCPSGLCGPGFDPVKRPDVLHFSLRARFEVVSSLQEALG